MPKKHIYEHVKGCIESSEGHQLLDEEYKNSKTKLKIKCPEGHIFWMKYNDFNQNHRCPLCYNNKRNSIQSHNYEDVKMLIEKHDYCLLNGEYINNKIKLKIQCPKGHIYSCRFDSFQRGQRCPECFGTKKKSNQEIIESIYQYENVRENENKEIEITCRYCGGWFVPVRRNLIYRILYINGKTDHENLFYCSDQCKQECPIYNQKKYPKGHKKATSREVQPQLRQLVFLRDNYTCQKCEKHKDDLEVGGLHCHHIWPLNENPVVSADTDECITLCKSCHKGVHEVPGCGYGELRCNE